MAESIWAGGNLARGRSSSNPSRVDDARPNVSAKSRIRFDFDSQRRELSTAGVARRSHPRCDILVTLCYCRFPLTAESRREIRQLGICLQNRQSLRTPRLSARGLCSTELFDKLIPTFGGYDRRSRKFDDD